MLKTMLAAAANPMGLTCFLFWEGTPEIILSAGLHDDLIRNVHRVRLELQVDLVRFGDDVLYLLRKLPVLNLLLLVNNACRMRPRKAFCRLLSCCALLQEERRCNAQFNSTLA